MIEKTFIHPLAIVEEGAHLGENVKIWHFCQVRKNAHLGHQVSLGKSSYVDEGVIIGDGTRIQNDVNIFNGVKIGSWCFVGPSVVFTNDHFPRVGNRTWKRVETVLENGCSIGAGAVVRCGISLGAFSMIGAGAVVTKNVSPFTLAIGLPAEEKSKICACGQTPLPIETEIEKVIRNCCKENMSDETYSLAKMEVAKLIGASCEQV